MTWTGAIVLFAVTWFMVFFCVLPLRFTSQAAVGEVVPGTPRSAPADFIVVRKAKVTTVVAVVVWAVLCLTIWLLSQHYGAKDLDIFGIMPRS
jgi:predicted secreted protein